MLLSTSVSSGTDMIRMQLTTISNKPLGSIRQDGSLHQVLPWCKARRLELSTTQPERYACSAPNSAAI